jgi:hypothetical protein
MDCHVGQTVTVDVSIGQNSDNQGEDDCQGDDNSQGDEQGGDSSGSGG